MGEAVYGRSRTQRPFGWPRSCCSALEQHYLKAHGTASFLFLKESIWLNDLTVWAAIAHLCLVPQWDGQTETIPIRSESCNAAKGMNGMDRLRKTVFEFSFAGFGGDGPGGLKIPALQVVMTLFPLQCWVLRSDVTSRWEICLFQVPMRPWRCLGDHFGSGRPLLVLLLVSPRLGFCRNIGHGWRSLTRINDMVWACENIRWGSCIEWNVEASSCAVVSGSFRNRLRSMCLYSRKILKPSCWRPFPNFEEIILTLTCHRSSWKYWQLKYQMWITSPYWMPNWNTENWNIISICQQTDAGSLPLSLRTIINHN